MNKKLLVVLAAAMVASATGIYTSVAYATHSWGGYHWARSTNPFILNLGKNLSGLWPDHLGAASTDWNISEVLKTTVIPGNTNSARGKNTPKNCVPTSGRVEVCNSKYGNNGWLGIASIWVSGSHITQGTVKLNDTYFKTPTYDTPAWRQFVMCQEVGHTFGLNHQNEIFDDPNLGTCMDYTNDPNGALSGQLSNLRPNAHDYEELGIIYQHFDALTTVFNSVVGKKSPALASVGNDDIDTSNPAEWGKVVRKSADGRSSLHERDLDKGNKVFTFVIWAN